VAIRSKGRNGLAVDAPGRGVRNAKRLLFCAHPSFSVLFVGDYRLIGRLSNMTSTIDYAAPELAAAGDPNFMTSLARGLAVIRGFSREKRHMTIAQLSQKTGIPRAAVRRCLYTLTRLGYVATEDGRSFALRPSCSGSGTRTSPRRRWW
jgi:hypothetical protein